MAAARSKAAKDVEPGEFGLALQAGVQAGLGLHRALELQASTGPTSTWAQK